MKPNSFRIILAAFVLSIGFDAIAMDAPEPMDIESSGTVTFISAENQEFVLPLYTAKRSGQVTALLELPSQEGEIKFSEISTNTLALLVQLLIQLDQMLQQNEQSDLLSQTYIPRKYQPFVNQALQGLSNPEITSLYNAAGLLDLPFILNATAAVIADRIYEKIRPYDWQNGYISTSHRPLLIQREQLASSALRETDFIGMNSDLLKYILRHITYHINNITEEYSIADYIAAHGQPPFELGGAIPHAINLYDKALTSLFGIQLLQNAKDAIELELGSNHLSDLSLDPQGIKDPFNQFINLQVLSLHHNELMHMPSTFFTGLRNLRKLYLSFNLIEVIPVELFQALVNLETLNLMRNPLIFKLLPNGIFAGLINLRELHISFNPDLNSEEKEEIKKELPVQTKINFM